MKIKAASFGALALAASVLTAVLMFHFMGEAPDSAPRHPATDTRHIQQSYFDVDAGNAKSSSHTTTAALDRASYMPQPVWPTFITMLERQAEFDHNADGILSGEERAEMKRVMHEEDLARYDLDADGFIMPHEINEALKLAFENSPRGQSLKIRFDADANGELDEDEQAAFDAFRLREEEELRHQRWVDDIALYDTNGDGGVSKKERAARNIEMGLLWSNRVQEATIEFDRDNDGVLSIQESLEADAVFQQRRRLDRFMSMYDSDADGSIGRADYSAFLSAYEQGDTLADINRDGVVSAQDLAAFTDMVTRSRTRP